VSAQVWTGLDVLEAHGFAELKGRRVGLIVNQASVDRFGRHAIDLFRQAKEVHLVALFAPEHGLDGSLPGGQKFRDRKDPKTGLPVYSLYAPDGTRAPSPKALQSIDVLIYDLQDIGIRSYTFISTLGLAMEACGEAGVDFWVLDRPDPLGGIRVEGPVLDLRFRSFVGQWPIPYVYGMTPGELALMIAGEHWVKKTGFVRVIPMRGWHRRMSWKETGLRWIPPSPLMTTPEKPFYLTATALAAHIGGISVGFGTPYPYECMAAPWLDSQKLQQWFLSKHLPGIAFDPITLIPSRGAYAGKKVHGIRFRFTDPVRAPLFPLNFYILDAARAVGHKDLYAQARERGVSFAFFDKLVGTDQVRKALAQGWSTERLLQQWEPELKRFRKKRRIYLLYPE